MLAYRYDGNGIYKGEVNCQLDPLESEKAGYEIYLTPANATCKEPLENKEGFDVKYVKDSDSWEYVEKKQDPEPTPYVPTEKEQLQNELFETKSELQASDYKALKFAEGYYTKTEYAPIKEERQELRDKINEIEAKLAALEAEEEVDETTAE